MKDRAGALKEIKRLEHVLRDLHFEGKPRFGRNLRETMETIEDLERPLARRFQIEEKKVFPFLRRHVPKLTPVLAMLEAERRGFRARIKNLKGSVRRLAKSTSSRERGRMTHKLREEGTYLLYFLKSHLDLEAATLYRVVSRDLRDDEKRELKGLERMCHEPQKGLN